MNHIFCAYMYDVVFVSWNNDVAVDFCGSFPLWRARSSVTSHVTMDQAAAVSHSGYPDHVAAAILVGACAPTPCFWSTLFPKLSCFQEAAPSPEKFCPRGLLILSYLAGVGGGV